MELAGLGAQPKKTSVWISLSLSIVAGCGGGGGGGPGTGAANSPPAANQPPTISGDPADSVVSESAYAFTPVADDPDGDTLTFSIQNEPSWASFDTQTGALTGTPSIDDVGAYGDIVISVSDGQSEDALDAFAIEVTAPPNEPPTIGGNPPTTVMHGEQYVFTPTASDPDDDSISFAVEALPQWASFDSATGMVSGVPEASDVGTYDDIVISVTDGQATTPLPGFSIEVVAAALGSVSLSWEYPTRNTDGSPLTDLAGFKIYWGTASGDYPNVQQIDNPGVTTFVVDQLTPGTYFFVCTALNTQNEESDYSNEVVRAVP